MKNLTLNLAAVGILAGCLAFGVGIDVQHGHAITLLEISKEVEAAKARGDYEAAAKGLTRLADLGIPPAQYELGIMYGKGQGVPQDYAQAEKWIRKSAEQRFAPAQNELGILYAGGKGVTKDEVEALKWFRKSAEQGFAPAQANLGQRLVRGLGAPKDLSEAAQWFNKAAAKGIPEAQFELGLLHFAGMGVPKDEAEALKLFRKAADQGHSRAQFQLSLMYAAGLGVAKDSTESDKWLRLAEKDIDSLDTSLILALLKARGRPIVKSDGTIISNPYGRVINSESARNPASARLMPGAVPLDSSWKFNAGELDELVSQQKYVDVVLKLRAKADDAVAITWLRQKAEEGHAPLQFELSRQLVKTNPSEALLWFAAGRIGATYDVMLCEDKTAREAPKMMATIYQDVIGILGGDQDKYRPFLEQGLKWHDEHPKRPSPIWICYHGMSAFRGDVKLIPENQWAAAQADIRKSIVSSLERSKSQQTK